MSNRTTLQELVRSVERKADSRIADSELLRRFHQLGDRQAFEMIVTRYGSLVRATCLRATRDSHHVDDAFQATFLILARKAQTIRRPEALPAWLVRVARRAALKRRPMQSITSEPFDTARSPLDQLSAREFLLMFDEELDRLPVNYRSALLLCLVEGKTVEETAKQLGTTHGTVRGWLQRGRERLRQRLKRRGLELSVILPAVVFCNPTPVSAAVHQSLLNMVHGTNAIPAGVAGLMTGTSMGSVLASMAGVLVLAMVLAGATFWPRNEEPLPEVITAQPPSQIQFETNPAFLPQDAIARIGSNSFRHGGEVTALAFSKDNRYLASASPADFENSVRVWEMATGKEMLRVPIQSNFRENTVSSRPVSVAFSDDNKQVRVIDWASYRAIDLASGKELVRHDLGAPDTSNQFFPEDRVVGTAFSPDGKQFAAVRGSGVLVIGDVLTGLLITTVSKSFNLPPQHHRANAHVAFSPDSSSVCVPLDTSVMLFDVKSGKHLSTYQVDKQRILKAILTGPRELSCVVTEQSGANPCLQVVDMATSQPVHQSQLRAWDVIASSPNGKWLAIGNGGGNSAIMLLDRASKKVVHRLPLWLNSIGFTFSPDSQWLAHSNNAGVIMIWNVESGSKHPLSSPNEFMFAQFEQDGLLRVMNQHFLEHYDWRTWRKVSQFSRNLRSLGTTYSSDRRLKAVNEREIIITDVTTNKEVHRFQPSDYCRRMAFTPDNRRLIGITQRDSIHLWDLESKTELWSHKLPQRSFGIVGTGDPELSRDGRRMALGCVLKSDAGEGYAIRVFDLQHKKEHACISAPNFIYGGICISPDGRFVAGGGGRPMGQPEEDAVLVWEIASGKRINTLSGHVLGNNTHCNAELRCGFTPDGRKLLTIDGKGTMRLWELSSGQVLWKSAENHGAPRFSLSPDGGVIVSSSFDAPVLLWDLYGNAKGTKKKSEPIDAEKLWNDLASDDAGKAFSAIRQLCAAPDEAIKLLRERLPPTKPRPKDAIAKWIKNLDSSVFAEREQAFKELLNILEEVEPQLRQVRAATTSDEVRRRVDALLLKTGKPSPDRLRHERSLDVLEHLGTPEAKQHLEILAKGAGNTPLTIGAQAALARMASLKAQP